jgi:regulator of protease activity HflC (stomatin/prohibitin superfamily)
VTGELDLLEHDVAQARQRLHDDLANLRRPGLANLKSDLSASADSLLTDIKDRMAANPVATVAIGAGVAWRLVQRPPVASLLVGYGLFSLFRTDPRQPSAVAQYAAQAAQAGAQFADRATQAVSEAREASAAGLSAARAAASQTADTIAATAIRASAGVAQAGAEAKETLAKGVADARDAATRAVHDARDAVQRDKDTYLLGFAAAALAAAIGISARRANRH